VAASKQGRTRYFRFADPDVAAAVEALIPIATRVGHLRTRPGPRDQAMRQARSCYDHLAGRLAVALLDRWLARRMLSQSADTLKLTNSGRRRLERLGVDIATLEHAKRPMCRTCIDWSERRRHLGGGLGAAILDHVLERRWAVREGRSRVMRSARAGSRASCAGTQGGEGHKRHRVRAGVTHGSRPATASLKCAVVSCAASPPRRIKLETKKSGRMLGGAIGQEKFDAGLRPSWAPPFTSRMVATLSLVARLGLDRDCHAKPH